MVTRSELAGARVIKSEPSATDTARLRNTFDEEQKDDLRQILGTMARNRTAAILTNPKD
jgi:hypothetical protein